MQDRTEIQREHIFWALLCLSLALVPHASRFSIWMLVCFFALAAWRIAGDYGVLPLPIRKNLLLWITKQALAVAAFVAIYISYQGQLGRDAGIALLTALLGLKVLELYNERDYYVVMFLGYFLVVTNFFYSQTVATAGFMLVIVVAVTAGLVRFNARGSDLSNRQCAGLAARCVAQALPLMVVGFFLFPRIPGPLWGLPQTPDGGITGLSDRMTIGHITELGVSDEIAFRVSFDGPVPRAQDLYWRGPVMWHSDGRSWREGEIGDGPPRAVEARGPVYRYTVIMEPHNERWLFGIEAVTRTDNNARMTSDYRLLTREPVKRRLRYSFSSQIDFQRDEITPDERSTALALPDSSHRRTRKLAQTWRDEATDDAAIVQRALRHFNQQAFVYTLTPRALRGDPIDQFLFDSREGFCEHYAAAFVTLMRAAGVPARVVTGYQGGEFNTVSDYLLVRQRDAHAWAEVYLDSRGWVRVDPTAAVAPERVSLGIDRVLPQRNLLPMLDSNSATMHALRRFGDVWDALNYNWSQWVLGYTPKRQRQLLDDAGLEDWDYGTLIIILTLSLTALMIVIALFVLGRGRQRQDVIGRAYDLFCRKLARAGFERYAHEGPVDYSKRVARTRSDVAEEVAAITQRYAKIRYAGADLSSQDLMRRVKAFKIRKR